MCAYNLSGHNLFYYEITDYRLLNLEQEDKLNQIIKSLNDMAEFNPSISVHINKATHSLKLALENNIHLLRSKNRWANLQKRIKNK